VLGALIQAVGRAKINDHLPGLAASARDKLVQGLGQGTAGHHVSAQITHATNDAYVSALQAGLRVSAVVALIGAVVAFTLVRTRPTPQTQDEAVGEHVVETDLVHEPARA
jgi:hypothetical protein